MKRYLIFAGSFVLLFLVFQMLSGYVITLFHTSDPTEAWKHVDHLSNRVTIRGGSVVMPLVSAFLAATIAYFAPKIFIKDNSP